MGKKRKKKVYNTPKKIKHVHQNKRLNIINVFNNNFKCVKCDNFLANHKDRLTCTYCQTSTPKICD